MQYKSRFSGLYLTRCSNFCERQRERAGGPGRVEQPALGRGEKGDPEREGASPSASTPTAPATTTHPRPPSPRALAKSAELGPLRQTVTLH